MVIIGRINESTAALKCLSYLQDRFNTARVNYRFTSTHCDVEETHLIRIEPPYDGYLSIPSEEEKMAADLKLASDCELMLRMCEAVRAFNAAIPRKLDEAFVKIQPEAKEPWSEYIGASITDIRKGKGDKSEFTYAKIIAADGTMLVSATFDYCVDRMNEAASHISKIKKD